MRDQTVPALPQRTSPRPTHQVVVIVLTAVFLSAVSFQSAWAQATAPTLGTAKSFAILAGETVTNTGPSTIHGDVGVHAGTAVPGFPVPGQVIAPGVIHAADAVASQAKSDLTAAYLELAGRTGGIVQSNKQLGGRTLVAGVYTFGSGQPAAQLTGTLKLDAQGNPDAVFIFQMGSTLTTASNANVKLLNGAQPCNVFWQVGSSATVGTYTSFIGNILALTSITLTTGASVNGRALARNGAVTLDTNNVHFSSCSPGGSGGEPIPGSGPGPSGEDDTPPVAVPGPICVDIKGPKPGETVLVTGTPTRTYLTILDVGSGLASIAVLDTTNADVSIPIFAPGAQSVVIMSTKLGPGVSGFNVKAIDVCGNVSVIDPVDFVITANQTVTLTKLPHQEHFVTVKNEGLQGLIITVNGNDARTLWLGPTATRTINIREAIERGNDNTITFEAVGYGTDGRAVVLVHPKSE